LHEALASQVIAVTPSTTIHIGYHKTATTWFQRDVYPRVANARAVPYRAVRTALLDPDALGFDPQAARRHLGAGVDPLILCYEGLVGHYINSGMMGCLSRDVARRLHAAFPEAQIVIFLRNQPEMLVSTYLQYLKKGGTRTVRGFLFPDRHDPRHAKNPFKAPAFTLDHLAYWPLIAEYRRRFGADRVHAFLYEALRADPRGFLADYARRLGLALDPDTVPLAPRNRAFGSGAMWLAWALNRLSMDDLDGRGIRLPLLPWKAKRALSAAWDRLPWLRGRHVTPARLFGAALGAEIAAHYAAHNARLATLTGLALAEHGYPMPAARPLPAEWDNRAFAPGAPVA